MTTVIHIIKKIQSQRAIYIFYIFSKVVKLSDMYYTRLRLDRGNKKKYHHNHNQHHNNINLCQSNNKWLFVGIVIAFSMTHCSLKIKLVGDWLWWWLGCSIAYLFVGWLVCPLSPSSTETFSSWYAGIRPQISRRRRHGQPDGNRFNTQ